MRFVARRARWRPRPSRPSSSQRRHRRRADVKCRHRRLAAPAISAPPSPIGARSPTAAMPTPSIISARPISSAAASASDLAHRRRTGISKRRAARAIRRPQANYGLLLFQNGQPAARRCRGSNTAADARRSARAICPRHRACSMATWSAQRLAARLCADEPRRRAGLPPAISQLAAMDQYIRRGAAPAGPRPAARDRTRRADASGRRGRRRPRQPGPAHRRVADQCRLASHHAAGAAPRAGRCGARGCDAAPRPCSRAARVAPRPHTRRRPRLPLQRRSPPARRLADPARRLRSDAGSAPRLGRASAGTPAGLQPVFVACRRGHPAPGRARSPAAPPPIRPARGQAAGVACFRSAP